MTNELLPRLTVGWWLINTLGHDTLHFPVSADLLSVLPSAVWTELLRRNKKMARPSSSRQRDDQKWWRRKSCPRWTAPALACPGATSSPSSLASASASLLGFGATWAWPSSAWSTATPSIETTKKLWWWVAVKIPPRCLYKIKLTVILHCLLS